MKIARPAGYIAPPGGAPGIPGLLPPMPTLPHGFPPVPPPGLPPGMPPGMPHIPPGGTGLPSMAALGASAAADRPIPTRELRLTNLLSASVLADPAEYEECVEDIKGAVEEHGAVAAFRCPKEVRRRRRRGGRGARAGKLPQCGRYPFPREGGAAQGRQTSLCGVPGLRTHARPSRRDRRRIPASHPLYSQPIFTASSYPPLLTVSPTSAPHSQGEPDAGTCFVRYEHIASAVKAYEALNGRDFDGNTVQASFLPPGSI
jgi:hypothetical protein